MQFYDITILIFRLSERDGLILDQCVMIGNWKILRFLDSKVPRFQSSKVTRLQCKLDVNMSESAFSLKARAYLNSAVMNCHEVPFAQGILGKFNKRLSLKRDTF